MSSLPEMPNARSILATLKELVNKDCADAITLRYTAEDTLFGETGISASPWYMTPFIIEKVKEIYDIPIMDDSRWTSIFQPNYSCDKLAIIKNGGKIGKKFLGEGFEERSGEIKGTAITVDAASSRGEKSLIICSGEHDVATLVFDAEGEPDIVPYPSSCIYTNVARLHPAFRENMEAAPRKAFVKEWLRNLLPGDAVINALEEKLGRPTCTLYDKAILLGPFLAGNIKLHNPLHRFGVCSDCLLKLPPSTEYSSVFPGQGNGFAATYVPDVGLFTQGFGLPDTHYVIAATDENRDALIARLYALRVAKLMGIPAVDAVWHKQDEMEYLVMSRYDMRNGMEIWRGKWHGDTEILDESDRRGLVLRQALNAMIFGMEPEPDFDLYEVVPTCFSAEEMNWESSDEGDGNAHIRLAPYIGMTRPFKSVPGMIKDSATANMAECHLAFELARQALTVEYPELSFSLAQFDIQKPVASH